MGFSEPQQRIRGRARPSPPVSAGVRKRGRRGKLTPFISFQEGTVQQCFSAGTQQSSLPMLMLIGNGDDYGKIALMKCPEEKANITLRRPSPGSTEYIIESTMIPYAGQKAIARTAIEPEITSGGVMLTLPWALPKLKGEL